MDIQDFWKVILKQDDKAIRTYFHPHAYINWHNTNEHFTVDEFIQANCEYPGDWDGCIERIEKIGDLLITATHVFDIHQSLSFHVVSFIRVEENLIVSIDEYWGDDGEVPQWRADKHLGKPIHK